MADVSTATRTATRERLLAGLAECLATRSLQATTVSDVVRAAGTSKRSFYAHFADRDDCFLALYDEATEQISIAVSRSVESGSDDQVGTADTRIERGVATFLELLSENAPLTRAHLIDIYSFGERGLLARRTMITELSHALTGLLAESRAGGATDWAPDSWELAALMGAIHEVLLAAVEAGETDLTGYHAQITDLVHRFARSAG